MAAAGWAFDQWPVLDENTEVVAARRNLPMEGYGLWQAKDGNSGSKEEVELKMSGAV